MILIRSILGRRSASLLRVPAHRKFCTAAAPTEEYARRNYANNAAEYTTVIGSLTSQRRNYLLRDVYDDMMLDGVQPTRDVFHSLILGTTKAGRLQDAIFFRDEMKAMGLVPDVVLYNFLISTCGKSKNANQAVQILDEMKNCGVKPNGQTYVCLLNACAAAGQLDRVYAIVRDMTAAGAGLNKFCYAGLIAAHINKAPVPDNVATKVVELVLQSKGWSSVESPTYDTNNMMMAISDEELYNLPTAEYVYRRGLLSKQLTVYQVAFYACAELRNVEAMETLLELLQKDGKFPDAFIVMQTMRCYLHSGDLDRGLKTFEDYMESGKLPFPELFATLVEGAMVGYTPRGMQIAQDALMKMNARNFFLSPKMGSDLLLVAAAETGGTYTVANLIWDLAQARKINLAFPSVEAYYNGLKMIPGCRKFPAFIAAYERGLEVVPDDNSKKVEISCWTIPDCHWFPELMRPVLDATGTNIDPNPSD